MSPTKYQSADEIPAPMQVDIVDNFLDLGRNLFPDNIFKASFQTVSDSIKFN